MRTNDTVSNADPVNGYAQLMTGEDRLAAIWRLLALGVLDEDAVLALEWSHVHLHSGQLIVPPQFGIDGHRGRDFRRTIGLDRTTVAALARLRHWRADARLQLGADWHTSNRVVVHFNGAPMTRTELAAAMPPVFQRSTSQSTPYAGSTMSSPT